MALTPDSVLRDILARIRLSDLIGKDVKLRANGREFVGLSPFQLEKTPSFTVNNTKGIYHCFASKKHGDAIQWLIDYKGMSFRDAVQTLADLAGVELTPESPGERARGNGKNVHSWHAPPLQHIGKVNCSTRDRTPAGPTCSCAALQTRRLEKWGLAGLLDHPKTSFRL